MDTTFLGLLMILVILLIGALIAFLYMQLRKLQDDSGDSAATLHYLAQILQQSQIQSAALEEKLNRIESVTEAVSKAEIELRGLSERVATMEQSQAMASQSIVYLSNSLFQTDSSLKSEFNKGQQRSINTLYQIGTRLDAQISKLASEISQFQQSAGVELAELRAMATSISEAISSARSELFRAKNDLAEIQSSMKARTEIEQRTAESIRRLEAVIAGTQSKGSAGENILESAAVPALSMMIETEYDLREDDLALALGGVADGR